MGGDVRGLHLALANRRGQTRQTEYFEQVTFGSVVLPGMLMRWPGLGVLLASV